MPTKSELEQLVQSICKSNRSTDASKTLQEIEDNNNYIIQVQLKRILKLHDEFFKSKSVIPLQKLYEKYNENIIRQGDLQNWAELVDRDLRVLELTMQLVRRRK